MHHVGFTILIFKAAITKTYPRILRKLVADHLGSADNTWGTGALYVHRQTRYTFYIYVITCSKNLM
jgi:hypothetical protein